MINNRSDDLFPANTPEPGISRDEGQRREAWKLSMGPAPTTRGFGRVLGLLLTYLRSYKSTSQINIS